MEEQLVKNIEKATPLTWADLVPYENGKVVSLTLANQPHTKITLFSFDAGESISTHAAGGDAIAYLLEGESDITVDGIVHRVKGGEAIVMPKNIPHSLCAVTPFKMYLVVVI